jgi:hypothetical protein
LERSDKLQIVFRQWKKKLLDQPFAWPVNGAKAVNAVGLARRDTEQNESAVFAIMYV